MRDEENPLGLQVGDVVEITNRGNFSMHLREGDTLRFLGIEDSRWYEFSVLTCSRSPRWVGLTQVGTASWLADCIRKISEVPALKEVPHDTTTPLKVGDYVEVIYQHSDEVGLIKKIVGFNDAGYIRTLSQAGSFAGQEICYTKREYLSLIK